MTQPYEIHVTVSGGDVEEFKRACAEANVKPILLELHTRGGSFSDLQTSSVLKGEWSQVRGEIDRLVFSLEASGFDVVRAKVETWPLDPSAPTNDNGKTMPKGCYLESHVAVETRAWKMPTLEQLAKKHKAHLSRNAFKKISETVSVVMLTLRDHDTTVQRFKRAVEELERDLRFFGFHVPKTIVEFAIYDTNVHHDDAWLQAA